MIIEVIPDININNSKLSSFLTNIHSYKNLFNRINFKEKKISHQDKIIYEILFTKENISFYYIIPDELKELVKNELNVCYPKATFKFKNTYRADKKEGILNFIKEDHMIEVNAAEEFELDQHSFLSLKTDLRSEYPLNSLLETSKILKDGEKVLIQYILAPEEPSLNLDFEEAIKEFNSEKRIKSKYKLDKEKIIKSGFKLAYGCVAEVMDLASLFFTNEEFERIDLDELDNNVLVRNGLSQQTKDKTSSVYYDTSIRIATNSERSELLLKLFKRGFNLLEGDNKLVTRKLKQRELIEAIKERKAIDKINMDVLSTKELAQLMQLPTKHSQQEYKIKNIDTREINIPHAFTSKGLQIGHTKYKGNKIPLFFPLDDLDSLCQCWISIGKMGSGKTTCGQNTAIQLLQNGISVFAIDVADGDLINSIEKGLPRDFNKIIDLDFGDIDNPISLTWSECANGGKNVETKLASQLKNFLNKLAKSDNQKLSSRMERFLGAAAKAVFKNPTANLYDVILCLTDREYRDNLIVTNNINGRLKWTLEQLNDDGNETGTKQNYVSGIMDRLESLLDNEFAANCLLQEANLDIDFRKWSDEGYFVGIRIPKDTLLDDTTDLLVTYIVSKLWLSILTRSNMPKEQRKPCILILDEPHQFPTVLTELHSIIREMRKWRFGIFILAHEFGDFKNMKTLLKSAGTNYFIYQTSKETYKELLEELQPFTLEEMIATKWRHAIVNMRYKEEKICVMTDMLKPLPHKRTYKKENIFGRSAEKVQDEIFKKSMHFEEEFINNMNDDKEKEENVQQKAII
ncbi:ATP-binding protein [Clostridium sp. cpc1]|uniref:ATP-binding protein n=1 Tax=Clostridium sp. cpc1 TaxID=2016536 RepID=UPI0013CD0C4B|nr:ATP-binding protein [Clostridium sp. cpc1]MCW7999536.1 ATP-binding protein [Clostridium sp. cpc1]NFS21433.1 ATP-binding protein [Clostridium botulinum]